MVQLTVIYDSGSLNRSGVKFFSKLVCSVPAAATAAQVGLLQEYHDDGFQSPPHPAADGCGVQ
jgi:hypothetical protein